MIPKEDLDMFAYIKKAPLATGDDEGLCVLRTKLFGADVSIVARIDEKGDATPMAILCNEAVYGMLDVPDDLVADSEGVGESSI